VPAFTFSNEPVPRTAPAYAPFATFNTVPSNATTDPASPFKVNNSTAADERSTRPSTVNTVVVGNIDPPATVNAAPLATITSAEANRPEPLNTNVPAFTAVDPV
jgi:hypothetical protein